MSNVNKSISVEAKLISPPTYIQVIKLRQFWWAEYVAQTGKQKGEILAECRLIKW